MAGLWDMFVADLESWGFADASLAAVSLERILAWWSSSEAGAASGAGSGSGTELPVWFTTLRRVLREAPLKDAVLRATEQFIRNARDDFDPFLLFSHSPRALEVLARLACGSPFLTQTLLADPQCLMGLTLHGRAAETKDREQFVAEAMACVEAQPSRPLKLRELRRYQRRQLLRIGMCDAFGLMDLRFITLQLSLLADAVVQTSLNIAAAECGMAADTLTILAMGKLGGEELNYSSDIDLTLICQSDSPGVQRLARLTIDGLTDNSPPGFLYRVDLRLRPWGEAGPLVSSVAAYAAYLGQDAELWEKQAMLKARPIAGSPELGSGFLRQIQPLLFRGTAAEVLRSISGMKAKIESRLRQRGKLYSEVKLGAGSIRDIEFLVQSLQLIHGAEEPRIVCANTLDSLVRLAEFGLIPALWYRQLRSGYVFLRSVEHSLQLLHNQQTHELPEDPEQLEWLANRLDYPDGAVFLQRYEEHRVAVRTIFVDCLTHHPGTPGPDHAGPTGLVPVNSGESAGDADLVQQHAGRIAEMLPLVEPSGGCVVSGIEVSGQPATWDVLIVGLDFSGWLSVICGLLSIYRLNIRSGDAATGEGLSSLGAERPAGRFVACFRVSSAEMTGEQRSPVEPIPTAILQTELCRLGRLSRGGQIEDVRAELISRFCAAVPATSDETQAWDDGELTVELHRIPGSVLTEVHIQGEDSWGFLYELASALSLSRFRVLRAVIRADGQRVQDVLYVRERNGQPIASEERSQELQLAATLIKQFTHWLPSAGDPHHALLRFRELVSRLQPASAWADNMRSLQRPGVLHAVARVLGISQYLWETFLRSRHEELFPLLANAERLSERESRESLRLDLEDQAGLAAGVSAWAALNDFKDRHLFRIDMRHVLGHCRPFGAFSEELTELAELIVNRACELAWSELSRVHGVPCHGVTGQACLWMMAGLGKFGGVEMGFASDLELLLVYESAGQTDGGHVISNAEFFDRMIRQVESGIRAPQDGIFHVDLRMRPYGQAGPGAVLLADLREYYREGGPAWPYERQALVRFRRVAGDAGFGEEVTKAAREAIYEPGKFDFAAMQAMRERQMRQLVRGGTVNVKLSDGGLVDCEYAVQAIQLTHGRRYSGLQHPNTLAVLREASRLELISEATCRAVEGAYIFLRELIDCLRMVRGNARDLTLPRSDSRDWQQLSRRMTLIHDSEVPLEAVEEQMAIVRRFARQVAV